MNFKLLKYSKGSRGFPLKNKGAKASDKKNNTVNTKDRKSRRKMR